MWHSAVYDGPWLILQLIRGDCQRRGDMWCALVDFRDNDTPPSSQRLSFSAASNDILIWVDGAWPEAEEPIRSF